MYIEPVGAIYASHGAAGQVTIFSIKKTAIYTFQYLKIKLEKKFNYPLEGNNKTFQLSLYTCVWDVYCARGSNIRVACVRITT